MYVNRIGGGGGGRCGLNQSIFKLNRLLPKLQASPSFAMVDDSQHEEHSLLPANPSLRSLRLEASVTVNQDQIEEKKK